MDAIAVSSYYRPVFPTSMSGLITTLINIILCG